MTTTEAAAALGISPQRVWQLLRAGKLGGRKVGRDWQVDKESVSRRLEMMTTAELSERTMAMSGQTKCECSPLSHWREDEQGGEQRVVCGCNCPRCSEY